MPRLVWVSTKQARALGERGRAGGEGGRHACQYGMPMLADLFAHVGHCVTACHGRHACATMRAVPTYASDIRARLPPHWGARGTMRSDGSTLQ